nr:2-amino-4-hydroxy-6-hydroxymethyldihydropteridine diphosphokinase [candidate division Zixibacteria bacterium]
MSRIVYLGVGSNLGNREANLLRACRLIAEMEGFEHIHCSPIYISEAVDMDRDTPGFLNMVIKGQFAYSAQELLTNLENIEKKIGRESKGDYQPRTIDLDLLLFGDEIIRTDRLQVPHPRMTRRAFVLVPLLNIDPDLLHPESGRRLDSYLKSGEAKSIIIYREIEQPHVRT